ncbi:FAD-dependent monooxygenase, partial [Sulfurimonas sp. SAG-AH-194-L11]
MIETDILIVGGGPAGAIVAKYLSKSNVDNILVQRNLHFKKPCGGGIRLDAFDEFDIDKDLIHKYVDKIGFVFKSTKIEVDISEFPLGIVDRVRFDARLREDAVEVGTTLYEASFVSLEIFDEYIISKIKKDGEYLDVKSNYLIGADGVNSKIRQLVNGDKVSSGLTNYMDVV